MAEIVQVYVEKNTAVPLFVLCVSDVVRAGLAGTSLAGGSLGAEPLCSGWDPAKSGSV